MFYSKVRDYFLCSTRAQKVSPGHDGGMEEREEWCPGLECFVYIDLLVFYRGERSIPIKKAIYSKQSGLSLTCLPAKCHFAEGGGGGGGNNSRTLIAD